MSGLTTDAELNNISPTVRPERKVISGKYFVRLEPLDPVSHSESLYAASHRTEDKDEIWQYLIDSPCSDLASYVAQLERKATSEDPLFFAIIDLVSGKALGHVALQRIDPIHRVIEVGNVLYGKLLQKTPGATEVQYLLMQYVFDVLSYRRYEWKCNSLNAPSRRAAERFGFTFEGIFRQHMIVRGRNRDTAWFSILDSEWPRQKAAFEAWLAPSNFDATGQQRQKLSDFLN